jgi:hypothetical protein
MSQHFALIAENGALLPATRAFMALVVEHIAVLRRRSKLMLS